jgi:hypothetical protein
MKHQHRAGLIMKKLTKVVGQSVLAAAIAQLSFHAVAEVNSATRTYHAVDNSSVASTLASEEQYRAERSFKWGASRAQANTDEVQWSDVKEAEGFKWQQAESLSQDVAQTGASSSASQTGYRWGIRSDADQSGYRWGIRSDADQSGYRWGIRSDADQSGYRWGIRSDADQSGYRWGIRSDADQSGYRWGIR